MSWRTVGLIYLVAGILGALVLVSMREVPLPAASEPSLGRALLDMPASAVERVAFVREGRRVEARRDGNRWLVQGEAQRTVMPDLVAAAVATLTAGQTSEVMSDQGGVDLAAFGLEHPSTTIDVVLGGPEGKTVRILVGGPSPTNTAIYAMRGDGPAVYLVGLNLRYYVDLIFQAAGQAVGSIGASPRTNVATWSGRPAARYLRANPVA